VAKAYAAGAQCLEESAEYAIVELLKSQNADGSWGSHLPNDQVHSTLYALNTLLYLQNNYSKTKGAIDRGIAYILTKQQPYTAGGVYWQAGIFFSGGTKVREKIVWKSEAYTTALAADALSLWLSIKH
jgi:hypothetical protein